MTTFRGQISMRQRDDIEFDNICSPHKQMYSVSRRSKQMKRYYKFKAVKSNLEMQNYGQRLSFLNKEKWIQMGIGVNMLGVFFDTVVSKG